MDMDLRIFSKSTIPAFPRQRTGQCSWLVGTSFGGLHACMHAITINNRIEEF